MNRNAATWLRRLILAVCLLPMVATAQWRTIAVDDTVNAMRFNTAEEAHEFMRDYRIAQETGAGTYVSEKLYLSTTYMDGRMVSWTCFLHVGATGDYDPATCTGGPATVYQVSTQILPAEMSNTPFLDQDLGMPETTMCVGNPIHLGTGNKFQAEVDYQSGGPEPLTFARFYNSKLTSQSMGGWRHTFSRAIEINPGKFGSNQVVLHRPDGKQLAFYETTAGWLPAWTSDDRLYRTESGWRYSRADGVVETFDSAGHLQAIQQISGNVLQVSHSGGLVESVTDSYGRSLTFQHAGGRITALVDPSGQQIQYSYDGAGRLSTVTYQDFTTRGYVYDSPYGSGLLTGLIDQRGVRFATWAYDADGRAVLSEHAGGVDRVTVSYGQEGAVTVTNALGHAQHYTFSRHNGKLKPDFVEGAPCTGFVGGTEAYAYDSNGNLSSVTDRAGQARAFTYNSRGLETRRTTPDGVVVNTQWDLILAFPVKVTEPERITEYGYDTQRRLQTLTVSERSSGKARTWTLSYHPDALGVPGQLASIDGPRTDVNDLTMFGYDSAGNLTSITNALGHVTQLFGYDAHGRPGQVIDANGVTRTLTYDLLGRLTSATGPEGTTTYALDAAGLLTGVQLPNGVALTYEYDDAQRLVAVVDAQGNRRELTLNDLGGAVEEKLLDPAGLPKWLEQRTFNELGWLTAVTDAQSNTSTFGYDVVANLVSEKDPLNQENVYGYDGFHRRTLVQDPLGNAAQITYEDTGDIYRVRDPRGRSTYYTYNGFGEVTLVRSPDTGATAFTYDEAGNVASRKDAKGQVTTYTYDALNRLVRSEPSSSAEPATIYGYDSTSAAYGIGRLTSVSDGHGLRIFDYTPAGQLASESWEINGHVLTTDYRYDGAGLLTGITYPSGRSVEYARNAVGDVESVSTTAAGLTSPLASQIVRAPFGPVTSLVHGNNLQETRSLDQSYRVTTINVPGVFSRSYSYTADSNVDAIDNLLLSNASQDYSYDAADRLTGSLGAYGSLGFEYDANSNRIAFVDDGLRDDYEIRFSNNWLLETGNGSVVRSYDANGNQIQAGADVFTYDSQNRLVSATVDGVTAEYGYNHLHQRVTKALNGHVRLMLYDQAGNLLSEVDSATGQALAEYVSLDGAPLAYIEAGNIYQIHVDHLGTPQVLTDGTGQIAWEAHYTPFGRAAVASQGPTFNLRFPGQYFDTETGLHYNWHRYYDPATGRYITSDPIGLLGGLNTYGYVGGNPLIHIDPLGLEKINLFRPGSVENLAARDRQRDIKGVLAVYAHGNAGAVFDDRNREMVPLDAKQLADLIRESGMWNFGMPVLLGSCNTASGDSSIASQLAEILGVSVEAPDGYYFPSHASKKNQVSAYKFPFLPIGGEWRVFDERGRE